MTYKMPVILAGYGIEAAHARAEFRKLADIINIPILTTWKAADLLPEHHVNYCGRPGAIGGYAANIIIQKCDLLICIGARLDVETVGFDYDNFAPNADKIVVDIDENEAKKFPDNWCKFVNMDAKDYLAIHQFDHATHWRDWCRGLYLSFDRRGRELKESKKRVNAATGMTNPSRDVDIHDVVNLVNELSTKDDVIALGSSGPAAVIALQTWKIKEWQRILNCSVIGAMGTDIPGAIGACLGSGRKRTICITGDGGFMMNIQELEVVKRLNLPIKYFVCCNGGYGSIAAMQDNHFKRRVGCEKDSGLTLPDIEKVAASFDLYSMTAQDDDYQMQIEFAMSNDKPMVICVKTPLIQEQKPKLITTLVNGTLKTESFERLYPYIPADELHELMEWKP